jgi:putative oxidoreductase
MSLSSVAVAGVQTAVGLVGIVAGGAKVTHQEGQIEEFERYGYPQWFRVITGLIEMVAGVGLIVGIAWRPEAALFGGLVFSGTMIGAVATHVRIDDPLQKIAAPATLFVLTVVLLASQTAELV